MKEHLTIIKVGGKIVENSESLNSLLKDFAAVEGKKLLVHGGGRSATQMAARLGVETKMVDGRRITDEAMLEVVTMVYGGLVNKRIVAGLQALGIDAVGLTGADMNIVLSDKRKVSAVDYGWVGDVKRVNAEAVATLIESGCCPVVAPLTHDGCGHMLNTNADTMAGEMAKAMAAHYDVTLMFCFEKPGVLADENDDSSLIPTITPAVLDDLKRRGVVSGGMIPKLDNAIACVSAGVESVVITQADRIADPYAGTKICL
ncbi:MAG: acetylglutamate kinase [Bacteroidales bacterium]|jgi:acetylglutamate kinase|uniref:acetylglutamate kinase n=2 Tax=Candidatus Limisoma sp. TaxID=3076476 RepID=UPI003FF0017B|nr:acetylglutamate kinase [Bacteroidales bacterium]MBD9161756.1 acetylglutamate kinase [Bacteroidales bacterium]